MKEEKELSLIVIQKTRRNPEHVILEDLYVQVRNHDIKECEKIARDIFKKELK